MALLRAPPFAASASSISRLVPVSENTVESDDERLIGRALLKRRVGGRFWDPRPTPRLRSVSLIVPSGPPSAARDLWRRVCEGASAANLLLVLPRLTDGFAALAAEVTQTGGMVVGAADPHALLDEARDIHVTAMSDLGLLGLFAGLPVWWHGVDSPSPTMIPHHEAAKAAVWLVRGTAYTDPFTNLPTSASDTIALLADWRRMITRNREVAVCAGMSLWKRRRIAQFFTTGADAPPFRRRTAEILRTARSRHGAVAVWSTRIPETLVATAETAGVALHRVEDGFIRSLGLGSDLLPPASIIVDRQGIYFDPSRPSDLETLLATTTFDEALRARAKNLIDLVIRHGISKYAAGGDAVAIHAQAGQRVILVPGQVADDLSVRLGGGLVRGNADLLARVRAANPEAFIVYRPHPDVEAGHRPGAIPDPVATGLADQVSRGGAMAPLIVAVDEVHTLTSLAGFEALLRGRRVVTYGQPFYASWGLTQDHAPVTRRQRRLTVEELAAATLILYPRYVDPRTGLLCGPETLIARLADAALWRPSRLMRLRQLQGRLKRFRRVSVSP
jgi:capsular polysaccharide export protein